MKSFKLFPQHLELLEGICDAPNETVIRFDAALATSLGNAGAKRFLLEIELNFVCALVYGTEELRFGSLDEKFLVRRGSFGEEKALAGGNLERAHGVFVSIR